MSTRQRDQEKEIAFTTADKAENPSRYDDLMEKLLEGPYWVVDLLPGQVSADAAGQYFAWSAISCSGRGSSPCAANTPRSFCG